MNIPGLSGNLWPVHLKALPDELLSSWLVRLAHGNGLKVQTFCALVFGRNRPIWNRDIDKFAPDWLLEKLSEATGSSIESVINTSLRSYEGVAYETHQPNGNTRWITPLGIYHRTHRSPGLCYCPQCLADDPEPYFRKRWRLAFTTVCTEHHLYLLNSCPKCAALVAPHRSDMRGKRDYPTDILSAHCWKCGFDLRESPQTQAQDASLVRFQVFLENALDHGYVDWAGNPSMHSVVLFDGLRALIAGVMSKQTLERLKVATIPFAERFAGWPRAGLEFAPLSIRREVFKWIGVLLDCWPDRFTTFIYDNKLRYADLKGDSTQRPFWYEDVIRREAGCGYTLISQEEANAIANAVEFWHGRYRDKVVRQLSGRDISAHVGDRITQPVSDDVYEALMASIDHQIAGTLDKAGRVCLIRNKIMFAAGRILKLSQGELANLTIEKLHNLVPEKAELSFCDVARSPEQVRAWIEWYWKRIRPHLQPELEIRCIFTSEKTRRGFRRSTIGARFQEIVAASMLDRSIYNYKYWSKKHLCA